MTKIEWCGGDRKPESWNYVVGCAVISPGCANCYAMKQAARCVGWGIDKYAGLTEPSNAGPVWTGEIRYDEKALFVPLKWRKPRRAFVDSMGDLFFDAVAVYLIARGWAIMAACLDHEFIVLTKRAARMREVLSDPAFARIVEAEALALGILDRAKAGIAALKERGFLSNVILGTSAEDQKRADERIPDLLVTPAAGHVVSLEPQLERIDLDAIGPGGVIAARRGQVLQVCGDGEKRWFGTSKRLDWIIVGGESGSGARRFDVELAYEQIAPCRSFGVALFIKQLGRRPFHQGIPVPLKDEKGADPAEWPEALRVREWPTLAKVAA